MSTDHSATAEQHPIAIANPAITACPHCGQFHQTVALGPGQMLICVRCGSKLAARSRFGPGNTLALTLTSLILYFPAMLLPLIHLSSMGVTAEGRIWDGPFALWDEGVPPVAILVAFTCVASPLLLLLAKAYVLIPLQCFNRVAPGSRNVLRFLIVIRSWNMIDVYLLAILVAFIKLGQLADLTIGSGMIAFFALFIFASSAWLSFEPDDVWNRVGGCTHQ